MSQPILSSSFFLNDDIVCCADDRFFYYADNRSIFQYERTSPIISHVRLPCLLSSITTMSENTAYHIAIILTKTGSLYVNHKDEEKHFKLLTDKKVTMAAIAGEVVLYKDDKGDLHSHRVMIKKVMHTFVFPTPPVAPRPIFSDSFFVKDGVLLCNRESFFELASKPYNRFSSPSVQVKLPCPLSSIIRMEEDVVSKIATFLTADGSRYTSVRGSSTHHFDLVHKTGFSLPQ